MEDALLWVVLGAVAVGVLCALAAAVARGSAYDQIGRGGLSLEEPAAPASGAAASAVREEEVRQMLEARNARRVRRGQAELDVEAELERLSRPAPDAALAAEIRELVVARNRRRVRRGASELDVEAEVERQLRRRLT
jgi:hypothetical protein